LESFLVWYTTEHNFIIGIACGKTAAAEQGRLRGLSPTFKSGELMSKNSPITFCVPKIFCRALFGAIREITV